MLGHVVMVHGRVEVTAKYMPYLFFLSAHISHANKYCVYFLSNF